MEKNKLYEERLIDSLRLVSPGTKLREGLENILRAKTGALIVLGDSKHLKGVVDGGFNINCDFSAAYIYELAKMDGAIILNRDGSKILYANTQLIPNFNLPSTETGIRHRTAERVARQTNELVIAISQRRNIITLYKGDIKYFLKDIGVIITKANQAIQTLEKYKNVLDKALTNLSALEYDNLVTVYDVIKVIQKTEMVMRIVAEIEMYIWELGTEGRLVKMQLDELIVNIEEENLEVIKDYSQWGHDRKVEEIALKFRKMTSEELLDISYIARELGYAINLESTDSSIATKGYRLLSKIPRLPNAVIENLINSFGSLQAILEASIEELDEVEGIGEARARKIKDGLRRIREQIFLDII